MRVTRLLISALLVYFSAFANAGAVFQDDIDTAFEEIMRSNLGRAICTEILGANAEAISFHLGVSESAGKVIARNCAAGSPELQWIFPTPNHDIQKLSLKANKPRRYVMLQAQMNFPIESWTDHFTNTTVLLAGPEGLSQTRLIQLLVHEMAVYFDSKANPAHPEARSIPELRDIKIIPPTTLNPLLVVSDPLIAHTLTFIRALQVEFEIVSDLVSQGRIATPPDFGNVYLNYLISERCDHACLLKAIDMMRAKYLPFGLPLMAFSPFFRSSMADDLVRAKPPGWTSVQWTAVQLSLNTLPVEFLKSQFTGNPLADMQKVFQTKDIPTAAYSSVVSFLNNDLWPLERVALADTRLVGGKSFLEFMKVPLLSGVNISLSSGPRVRIGTGNIE